MFDIAAIGFQADLTDLNKLVDGLDRLAGAAQRYHGAGERTAQVTQKANAAHRSLAADLARLTSGTDAFSRSEAAALRVTEQRISASSRIREAQRVEMAIQRERAALLKQEERDLQQLLRATDPLTAQMRRLNEQMAAANRLHASGAISTEQHQKSLTVLTGRMNAYEAAQGKAAVGTRLAGYEMVNFGRQIGDVATMAAMGASPLSILATQGFQIAEIFGVAKERGVSFGSALKDLTRVAVGLLIQFGPILAIVGTLIGVFAALQSEAKRVAAAMDAAANTLSRVQEEARELSDQAWALSTATADTATKADEAAEAYNRQANSVAQLTGKIRELNALQLGKEIRESEKRLKEMVAVGNDSGFLGMFRTSPNEKLTNTREAFLKEMGFGAMGDTTGQNRSPDAVITQARRNPGQLSPDARRLLNAFNVAEVELTGFNAAYEAERQYLARLYAEANPATQHSATLVDEIEVSPSRKRTPRTPRDVTAERGFEVAREIAQAMQEELRARLTLATGAAERAKLEKRIIDAGLAEKTAEIQGRIAKIEDDKANTKKREQILALVGLGLKQGEIAELEKQAVDRELDNRVAKEAHAIRMGELDLQIELREAQAASVKSVFARNVAENSILKLRQEQERLDLTEIKERGVAGGYTKDQVELAKKRLGVLGEIHAEEQRQLAEQTRLVDAISEAQSAAGNFAHAFRRRDWAGALDSLLVTIETIKASALRFGPTGGVAAAAGAAGSLIGGRAGGALMNGLGAFMFAKSMPAISGALGLTGTSLGGLAAFAGPIGVAAAALTMLAPLLSGRPSNKGAGYDLITGALSGNKRDAETEQAARSAGEAIKAIEAALKDAGVGLKDSVTGLVIGTRDATQIYLQSGRELRSAVGDSGAAVDTAMRALLEGAEYVSDAQRRLVMSAVEAGKGFDAVAEVLAKWESAQGISKALDDEILRLTDPKAYDLKAVTDAIEAQRKGAEQLAKDGYLTAAQLATINGRLDTLKGLQIDEVLKRYAEAVNDNTQSAADAARAATRRRELEIAIMEAEGRTAEALAAKRADELEELRKLDPALVELQQRFWDLSDAAERAAQAAEKAAQMLSDAKAYTDRIFQASRTNMGLDADLQEALGNSAAAVAIRRQLQLEGMDPLTREKQMQVWAVQDAMAQITSLISSTEQLRDRFQEVADRLGDFSHDLSRRASEVRGLQATYDLARSEYSRLLSKPITDQASLQAFLGAANGFLDASQASQSALQYAKDIAAVKLATESAKRLAEDQVDVATQQLQQLQAAVAGIGGVGAAVVSVEQAISALAAAMAGRTGATGGAGGAGGGSAASSGGSFYADLSRQYGSTMAEIIQSGNIGGWAGIGGGPPLMQFATGGSFDVEGPSSGDQVPVMFRANGGEHVNVTKEDSIGRLADAVERQNRLLERIANSNQSMDDRDARRDWQGFPVRGEQPGDPVRTEAA